MVFNSKKGDDLTIEDLATTDGVAVGAQRSTISSQYLEANYPKAEVKLYDSQDNAYLDLTSGRIRGLLADKVIALDWLKAGPGLDFEVKGNEINTGDDTMGIALRKGDPLVAQFNTALAELKANGKYDEIGKPYLSMEGANTVASTDTISSN